MTAAPPRLDQAILPETVAALAHEAGTTIGPRCATIHDGQEASLHTQAGYTTAADPKARRQPFACEPGGVHIRAASADGVVTREPRDAEFAVILSLGLPTRLRWLEFTVEAIFLPFDRDSTPELEFETNVVWLPSERTGGWVGSHFDVVDKFSAAERPTDRRAYTHKLNLELDTSVSIFNWLRERRWLRSVELEGSLDYVATGLPKTGDVIDGRRYLDNTSSWSFSLVFVLPVAPM